MSAGVASAITAPALYAVDAAPGAVLEDLGLMCRRITRQELAVIGDLRQPLALNVIERIGQRHLAKVMMMPVTLTIGGDVQELRPVARIGESAEQAVRKML